MVVGHIRDGEIVACRHGLRFRVSRDGMYVQPYLFGAYEPALTRILLRLVGPGDVVVDVGANFGWYTCLLARAVGPAGEVHAFEPVPRLAAMTQDAIDLNGAAAAVRLVRAGLGDRVGSLTMYTFRNLPHGHAAASDLGRDDAVPVACDVTTLDDYARTAGIDRISVMKVDVEGHEPFVFAGGHALLSSPEAPVIAFEVNPSCLVPRGLAAWDVESTLRDLGYTEFWTVGRRATRRLGAGERLQAGDFLAVKGRLRLRSTGARRRPDRFRRPSRRRGSSAPNDDVESRSDAGAPGGTAPPARLSPCGRATARADRRA
jgi:FkbM family methyltransferase